MRRDEWARLAAPFPAPALAWCVAKLDREAGSALLEPVVAEEALTARLDEALGVEGWSKRLRPLGADAVVCELELLDVCKAAAASSFGGVLDMARVSACAYGRAAALFGLRPPTREGAWVDFDIESGEPLFLPDADGPGTAGAAADIPASGPADSQGDAHTSDAEARSGGQQVIERLVERLKDEGLGGEAARLVVAFGGYGRTPQEARELYRRLRELLLEKGTAP